MTPDSALTIRNALLNTLRVGAITPAGLDREVALKSGIEDAIGALDAVAVPAGDPSLPAAPRRRRRAAKSGPKLGDGGRDGPGNAPG